MSENECAANLMAELERELGVKGPANVLRAALKIAKEAAAEAKEVEPPAPPAWMVEVAREGCAQEAAERGDGALASSYRRGHGTGSPACSSAIAALRLALERGHVVVPRPMPSEEEMLRDAREDVAQASEKAGDYHWASLLRSGDRNDPVSIGIALQARRNVLSEIRAVAPAAVPEVDLKAIAERAWDAGVNASEMLILSMRKGGLQDRGEAVRSTDVATILTTLPTRGA